MNSFGRFPLTVLVLSRCGSRLPKASGSKRIEDYLLDVEDVPAVTLGGQTIEDFNRNGVHDAGELGQSGVTLELIDSVTGEVLESVVTTDLNLDADPSIDPETERGRFSLEGLNNGPYRIRRSDVSGQDVGVDLSDTQAVEIDLGDRAQGSIAGRVLNDTDFDQVGDIGVAGVTVFLDLDATGTPTDGDRIAMTDEFGNYSFSGLLADEYSLGVVAPADFETVDVALRQVTLGIDEQLEENDFPIQLVPVGLESAIGPVLRLNEANDDSLVLSRISFGSVLASEQQRRRSN